VKIGLPWRKRRRSPWDPRSQFGHRHHRGRRAEGWSGHPAL